VALLLSIIAQQLSLLFSPNQPVVAQKHKILALGALDVPVVLLNFLLVQAFELNASPFMLLPCHQLSLRQSELS
jgi:hypothetical protein